jgi:hypothetical protein
LKNGKTPASMDVEEEHDDKPLPMRPRGHKATAPDMKLKGCHRSCIELDL